jgi:transposase
MRFDLSDEEWAINEPHLPLKKRGPDRVDDRRVSALEEASGKAIELARECWPN